MMSFLTLLMSELIFNQKAHLWLEAAILLNGKYHIFFGVRQILGLDSALRLNEPLARTYNLTSL